MAMAPGASVGGITATTTSARSQALASQDPAAAAAAAARTQLDSVLQAMAADLESPGVQEQGCKAFRLALAEDGVAQVVVSVGGPEALLKAMNRHRTNVGIQIAVCWTLADLSTIRENACRLAALEAASLLTASMGAHSDIAELQTAACVALRGIAVGGSDCQAHVASYGAIGAVLHALRTHAADAVVQEAGCKTLKELAAYSADNQAAIGESDGLQMVVQAMRNHSHAPGLQEAACGVIRNMAACNASFQTQTVALGGIGVVLRAMQVHASVANVQWAGCWALFCLGVHNAAMQQQIFEQGGGRAVIRAMGVHRARTVQEAGCWALRDLSAHSQSSAVSTSSWPSKDEMVKAARRALEAHAGDAGVQNAARIALRKLASTNSAAASQRVERPMGNAVAKTSGKRPSTSCGTVAMRATKSMGCKRSPMPSVPE